MVLASGMCQLRCPSVISLTLLISSWLGAENMVGAGRRLSGIRGDLHHLGIAASSVVGPAPAIWGPLKGPVYQERR